MDLHVIVRAAGERTAAVCCEELGRQTSADAVSRVEFTPFWRTLREGLLIGRDSGAPWVMSVDADVIPDENAVEMVRRWTLGVADDVGIISGMIQDKFMASIRFGGIRVYRASVIQQVLDLMPSEGENVRPESTSIRRLCEQGWKHELVPELAGLHDYEQFYRDIYRKSFLHMQKHGARAAKFIDLWRTLADEDDDFRVALVGAGDALLWKEDVDCDAGAAVYRGSNALERIGLAEKEPLRYERSAYRVEVDAMQAALDSGKIAAVSPTEQRDYDAALTRQGKVARAERLGTSLKLLAEEGPELKSVILHQVRRSVPDRALLDTFSIGELAGHVLSRLTRLFRR